MGRSFLAIKLALAFGLCVAFMVVAAARSASGPVHAVVEHRELVESSVTEAVTVEAVPGDEVVCLWRACPGFAAGAGRGLPTEQRTVWRRSAPKST
ncbi:hypothetical protein BH23GEM9_BH23GEM9_07260 [soil metagenome]